MYVIECANHNHERWDVREKKNVRQRLFLYGGGGFPMSPDIIWLQSITRSDSGTWFVTNTEKAEQFDTEDAADEKLTMLVMELGYLPGNLVTVKIEPPKEESG